MAMTLVQFVAKHVPQDPQIPPATPDQHRLLGPADGVLHLTGAPFPHPVSGTPGLKDGRHLWVIARNVLPVLLENAPMVCPPPLESGVAKHTNLTGGAMAFCGGELWVDAAVGTRLYVNGGSGRYQPRSPGELADAVEVFEGLGYQVESAGWDADLGRPARMFRAT